MRTEKYIKFDFLVFFSPIPIYIYILCKMIRISIMVFMVLPIVYPIVLQLIIVLSKWGPVGKYQIVAWHIHYQPFFCNIFTHVTVKDEYTFTATMMCIHENIKEYDVCTLSKKWSGVRLCGGINSCLSYAIYITLVTHILYINTMYLIKIDAKMGAMDYHRYSLVHFCRLCGRKGQTICEKCIPAKLCTVLQR